MSEIAQPAVKPRGMPVVRAVTWSDIREAMRDGWADFRAAPLPGLFFGGVYAAGGLLMTLLVTRLGASYLVYPLAAGFALIAPFVACGLYEVSRMRDAGRRPTLGAAIGAAWGRRAGDLSSMAFVTLFVFIVWMYQTRLLLALFLGFSAVATVEDLVRVIFTTPEGLAFLAVGHLVGAVLAALVFSITVVSFPLLLDRDVDFVTAIITSVSAVAASPLVMLGWAALIVAMTALAIAPAFLGLVVVLPVLGHATWRLYRKAVVPPDHQSA